MTTIVLQYRPEPTINSRSGQEVMAGPHLL